MREPLRVSQSVWQPGVMPLHLCAPPNRHRERTKTSHFAADDATISSQAIVMEGCVHAVNTVHLRRVIVYVRRRLNLACEVCSSTQRVGVRMEESVAVSQGLFGAAQSAASSSNVASVS